MSRVVVFDEFGAPDVLRIAEEPVTEPAAGEVRVKIEAFALNPLDRMMRSGLMPAITSLPHSRLGVEATGVVEAAAPDVTGLPIGTPVLLAAVPGPSTSGTYADHTTVPATQVIPRPAGLTTPEAAAVWVAYSTAYGALVEKAGMRPGDHVLITAASGSVGRAAVQIAHRLGAIPLALTRRTPDTPLAAAAVDQADIAGSVRSITGGAGADIVLDLVMGPGQQDLVQAARPGGTLVAAGFLDPRPTPFPTGVPLTFHSYRSFEHTLDPAVVRRMAAFLTAGLDALRPTVGTVFSLDDIVEAHRHLEKGHHHGKIVVTP